MLVMRASSSSSGSNASRTRSGAFEEQRDGRHVLDVLSLRSWAGSARGAILQIRSLGRPRRSRLVAKTDSSGHASVSVATSWRTGCRRCSQLSSTTSHGPRSRAGPTRPPAGSPMRPRRPSATARTSGSAEWIGHRRPGSPPPRSRSLRSRRAVAKARLVLPTPPGPTSVTSDSDCTSRAIPASSASRPMSADRAPGMRRGRAAPPRIGRCLRLADRDLVLELGHGRRGHEPGLVGQEATVDVRGPQRFSRSTRPGQCPHVQQHAGFAKAILGDRRAGDLDRLPEVPARDGQLGMEVGGGQALLLERLPPRSEWPDVGELLERPAAPQATGLTDEGQSRVWRRTAPSGGPRRSAPWRGGRPARRAPVAAGSRRRRSRAASPPRRGAVATGRCGSGGPESPKPPRRRARPRRPGCRRWPHRGAAIARRASTARRLGPGTTTSTPSTVRRNGPSTAISTRARRLQPQTTSARTPAPVGTVSAASAPRAPTSTSPAGSRSRTDLGRRQRHQHLAACGRAPSAAPPGSAPGRSSCHRALLPRPCARPSAPAAPTAPTRALAAPPPPPRWHRRHAGTQPPSRRRRARTRLPGWPRRREEIVMAGERGAGGARLFLPPPRRALDVGEQDGHRARGRFDRHAAQSRTLLRRAVDLLRRCSRLVPAPCKDPGASSNCDITPTRREKHMNTTHQAKRQSMRFAPV